MTRTSSFDFDLCILGTGRVGLPLGLSAVEAGLAVVGVDLDADLREAVNAGKMPFHEPGYDEVVATRQLVIHGTPEVASRARAVVITVGTPIHAHIETDLRQLEAVLASVRPHLRKGQLLCLRSTVAPGTTEFVRRWIERSTDLRVGHDLGLAFCPERIAEGRAREELKTLPQVIGTTDASSAAAAERLFSPFGPEILHTDPISAELTKLFNNIARYIHFAVANQFALIADSLGANVHEIRRLTNHSYPRNGFAAPGLTAGTCLRKDFGMINEANPYTDLLLAAWKINEYMPSFLVEHMKKRTELHDKVVTVLGYSFKAETDDIRDSLAPKLHRYIAREVPAAIRVNDPHLPDPILEPVNGPVPNVPLPEALAGADCVFVATNHRCYAEALEDLARTAPEAWVADLWNVSGSGRVFYRAAELLEDGA